MQFVLAGLWFCNVSHAGELLGWQQARLKQACFKKAVFQKALTSPLLTDSMSLT